MKIFIRLKLSHNRQYNSFIYRAILSLILVLSFSISFSQGIDRITEYSMPTPNAAEITRHTLSPVDLYTGVPEISIPFTSLNFDGKEIPINLRYHAAGIQTSQEATWIGLGWSLTGIPVITRRINQKSDIGSGRVGGSLYYSGYCYENYAVPSSIAANSTYENFLNTYPGPYFDKADTQPDIFSVSLFGEVVKFQLTQKISTNNIQTIILNDSKAEVTYIEATRDFTIKASDGFIYYFTHKEYSSNISAINAELGLANDVFKTFTSQNSSYNYSRDAFIITSWFLDKIVSPNGKILNYNYKGDKSELYNSNGKEDRYVSHGPTIVAESMNFGKCQPNVNNNDLTLNGSVGVIYGYQRSLLENKFLMEIIDESSGDRIVFKSNDQRKDLLAYNPSQNSGVDYIYGLSDNVKAPQRLYEIEKYSMKGEIVNRLKLTQSYFNSGYENSTNQDNYLRLKLDNVNIDGLKYSFEYEQPNSLPPKTTPASDFWGYYNGQTTGRRVPRLLIEYGMPAGKCNKTSFSSNYPSGFQLNGGYHGSMFTYGKIGVIKKVIYPTNGLTEYVFESNTARINTLPSYGENGYYLGKYLSNNNLEGAPISHSNNNWIKSYKVGGLRVHQILMKKSDNTLLLKKEYRYEDNYGSSFPISSGVLMDDLFYYYPVELLNSSISGYVGTNLIASNYNKVYVNGSAHGGHIGYDRVQETQIDGAGLTNGKTISYFKNKPNFLLPASTSPPKYLYDAPPLTFEEGNGKILKQQFYDNSSGTPVKEILNNYQDVQVEVSNGLKVYYSDLNLLMFLDGGYQSSATTEVYDWYSYKTKKSYSLLTSTIVTENMDSGPIVNLTNYYYDSKPQLKSIIKTLPNNEILETKLYYPYNTEYGVSSQPYMSSLVSANIINKPVYIRNFRDNNLINHEFVKYGSFNNFKKPTSIHYQKSDASLSSIEARINYATYDNFGNVSSLNLIGGPTTKYVWGYEGKYPVAKIENVENNATAIESIINLDVTNNSRSTTGAITTEIDKIRDNSTYSRSMVTAYAYQPGRGIDAIADPRNYSTSYEYDSSNRLKKILNDDGDITSAYNYRLLNEVPCTDCDPVISLGSNYYARSINQTFNITRSLPLGIGSIQRWVLDKGDGTITYGTGTPYSSFNLTYSTTGLKPVRLYTYFSDGSFITGNINIRVK